MKVQYIPMTFAFILGSYLLKIISILKNKYIWNNNPSVAMQNGEINIQIIIDITEILFVQAISVILWSELERYPSLNNSFMTLKLITISLLLILTYLVT